MVHRTYILLTHAVWFITNSTAGQLLITQQAPVSWIFSPGIHSSEQQVAKYCKCYQASTGQIIKVTKGINVLNPACTTAINFPEVNLETSSQSFSSLLKNSYRFITTIYNIVVQSRSAQNSIHEGIDSTPPTTTLDIRNPAINLHNINFGQELDVNAISMAYDIHVEKFPDAPIVMYGVSRGAAATFDFLTTVYLTKEKQSVKAVILEGCFDSIENLLQHKFSYIAHYYPTIFTHIKKAFSLIYPSYKIDGISPIKNVALFPKNIPILLITSKADTLVPAACTKNLYAELIKNGHQYAHLIELQNSSHPRYMMDDPDDTSLYQSEVHAFYQRYAIPYQYNY